MNFNFHLILTLLSVFLQKYRLVKYGWYLFLSRTSRHIFFLRLVSITAYLVELFEFCRSLLSEFLTPVKTRNQIILKIFFI